jgi:signal peptidase II
MPSRNSADYPGMKISKGVKAILLIVLVLLVDQIVKFQIKTTMTLGESIYVAGRWFQIRFIENPGMAFGLDIPGRWGKPLLTLFRIVAVVIIGWYMRKLILKNVTTGLVLCVALIFAGATGNIIDSVFYGLVFNESTYFTVATLFPEGGGYAPLLYGKVVDMLYFPVIQGTLPQWFPFRAGEEFIFFRPIFNLADSSITVGIFSILIFQRRFFHGHGPVIEGQSSSAEATEDERETGRGGEEGNGNRCSVIGDR